MDLPEVPAWMRSQSRRHIIEKMQGDPGLDQHESDLFNWFVQETDQMLDAMRSTEDAYIQKQIDSGAEDINDSGVIAVEYFMKRMRYSHVIFLTSLFETYLERSCERLKMFVGEGNMPFGLEQLSGDKWAKRKRFLEGYGRFVIDHSAWEPAEHLMDVRNILVHDGGSTVGLSQKKKTQLSQLKGLKLDDAEITVEPEFVRESFDKLMFLIATIQGEIGEVATRALKPRSVASTKE